MITTEQRTLRKKYIGSSDAAAILGLDPYRSAADVWYDKTGRDLGFDGNEATERGDDIEPALLNYAERKLEVTLERNVMVVSKLMPELAANLDGFAPTLVAPIEGKSTCIEEGWGEVGTDQVPDRVLTQVHHQMFVVGPECRVAYVPVVFPAYRRFDFRLYRIDRNNDLSEMVATACADFLLKFIQTDIRPDDFRPSIEVLKRARRQPGVVAPVAFDLYQAWAANREARLAAEKREKLSQAALIAALGDAEAGELPDGSVFTYLETKRAGYTVAPTVFRQLRPCKAARGDSR